MKSMTGMGRSKGHVLGLPTRIELKSVNHRFCEVNLRMPSKYYPLEILIQKKIKSILSRGKVDFYLFEEKTPELSDSEREALSSYHSYLKTVCSELSLNEEQIGLQDLLKGASAWSLKEDQTDELWQGLEPLLETALKDLEKMREQEGGHLKGELSERFKSLEGLSVQVQDQSKAKVDQLEERLHLRISERQEQLKELDPQRLHTEVLYYLDRMDVSEEIERLGSHLKQVKTFLEASDAVGRKLDFLVQELNREFNTIASKSQSAEISHVVVQAKAELEKVREQIQNIE